jgi:hypothetical protein
VTAFTRRVALIVISIFTVSAILTVLFPFAMDYGEGPILDQVRRLLAGQSLYQTQPNAAPFVISNYPPVYLLVVAGLRRLTHLPLLAAARLISVEACLVTALLIGSLARHLWRSEQAAAFAVLAFLGNVMIVDWSMLARVDALALMFSVLSLWIVYHYWHSNWGLLATLVGLLLSIYTRQSYLLAAPVAVSAWLWRHDRRRALVFSSLLALSCGAIFVAVNRASHGGFYFNIVTANLNHYLPERAIGYLVRVGLICLPSLLLASRAVFSSAASRLPIYTVGAGLSALTVGKVGSSHNYVFELIVALTLWAAGGVAGARCVRLIAQAGLSLVGCALVVIKLVGFWHSVPEYAAVAREVRGAARLGPVLVDETALAMVPRIYYQPFEYLQLAADGRWDPSLLARQIEAHAFPLIVLEAPDSVACEERWGASLLALIHRAYIEGDRIGKWVCYRPRRENDAVIAHGRN